MKLKENKIKFTIDLKELNKILNEFYGMKLVNTKIQRKWYNIFPIDNNIKFTIELDR